MNIFIVRIWAFGMESCCSGREFREWRSNDWILFDLVWDHESGYIDKFGSRSLSNRF